MEQIKPEERPHDLGVFQPMAGGWQNLHIAMGNDLKLFSAVGPGQSFTASIMHAVMTNFLKALAPHSAEFAALKDPPKAKDIDALAAEAVGAGERPGRHRSGYTPCMIARGHPVELDHGAVRRRPGAAVARAPRQPQRPRELLPGRWRWLKPVAPVVGEDTLVTNSHCAR